MIIPIILQSHHEGPAPLWVQVFLWSLLGVVVLFMLFVIWYEFFKD